MEPFPACISGGGFLPLPLFLITVRPPTSIFLVPH